MQQAQCRGLTEVTVRDPDGLCEGSELSDRELEEFLDHVESCPACHDELEIYFSIYQTLGEETDDGDYNFTRKLDEKLQRSEQYLTRRHIFRSMKIVLIVCAELFFIAAFSGLVTRELGEVQSTIEMVETETEPDTQGLRRAAR